jgi:outer membrane protein TolC
MVLVSIEYKKIMEDNLSNTQELYDETEIYYENGFREEQDVDQLKLLLRNAESEVLRADRELTIAKVVLKYAMGYDLEQDIILTDSLQQYLLPLTSQGISIPFDFNNHVDYRLAIANFEVSKKMLKLEKAAYLPRLSSFYSYSKTAYGNNANLFNSDWYPSSMIGFQITVPIFNSGQKMKKVQQARVDVEKAETDRRLTEITLQKDYLTAKAQKESALERFQNDRENRILAEKIRVKTNIKFDNGLSSSTELMQIETQYIDAYRALVTSTLQLLQADLDLSKVLGKL